MKFNGLNGILLWIWLLGILYARGLETRLSREWSSMDTMRSSYRHGDHLLARELGLNLVGTLELEEKLNGLES